MNVVELIISVLVFLVSVRIVVDLNGKWGEQAWRRLFPDTPLGRAHRRFMGFAVIALCLASMFVFTRSLDVHTSNGVLQAISATLAVLTFISICFALVAALFNWPLFVSMPAHRDEPGYFSDLRRGRQRTATTPARHEIWDKAFAEQAKHPTSTRSDGIGKIVFYRTRAGGDNRRGYKLEVDGKPVGVLAPASTFEVTVPAGVRVCRARIDWTGSDETEVPVTANGTTWVLVEARTDRMLMESARWLQLTVDRSV